MNDIQITLIANAGVLVAWKGIKLLVDGLYHYDENTFSNPAPETEQKLLNGQPPYDHIDYLLFTHAHADHFSPEITASYVEQHRVQGVLLPPPCSTEQDQLRSILAQQGLPCFTAGNCTVPALDPDIRVEPILTRHLDRIYWNVPHFALLITLGTDKLLFTGDTDYTQETFSHLPHLRAAFVNPLFFRAIFTGHFFHGKLLTDALCVYHVPFPANDCYHMRRAVEHDAAQWAIPGTDLLVLDRPDQTVVL